MLKYFASSTNALHVPKFYCRMFEFLFWRNKFVMDNLWYQGSGSAWFWSMLLTFVLFLTSDTLNNFTEGFGVLFLDCIWKPKSHNQPPFLSKVRFFQHFLLHLLFAVDIFWYHCHTDFLHVQISGWTQSHSFPTHVQFFCCLLNSQQTMYVIISTFGSVLEVLGWLDLSFPSEIP